LPPLRLSYARETVDRLLAEPDVLVVLGFGNALAGSDDPRFLRVGLEPASEPQVEVWRGRAPVRSGRDGALRWSSDGDYLFFAIEVDEATHGGLDPAAEYAYREIGRLLGQRRFDNDAPAQILRLWNYLDAINEGAGDDERYRHFCSGRARGMAHSARGGFSAATAIGRHNGARVLQVYGLAARVGGVAVENPRQLSAWRYPREYGPVSPTFARATRTPAEQLLVSGTAAVVGHVSLHAGDTLAQIDETLINLNSLLAAAGPAYVARGVAATLLKAYVRDPADASVIEQHIRARHPDLVGLLVLVGDICRVELRVEIDGIQS
jgi:chorismate lyase/3-hydroxybenzoate synthase